MSSVRDQVIAGRISRELTSSSDRKRRREKAAAIASRVQALRMAVPAESSWRVAERESLPALAGGPARAGCGLIYHVKPQADLAVLAGLPAEIPAVLDQAKKLGVDLEEKIEAIQKDSELGAGERLDCLLLESERLLDRAEALCSESLKEVVGEYEQKKSEAFKALTAGAPHALDVWITGTLSSRSPAERALAVLEAAANGDASVIRAVSIAPLFANAHGTADLPAARETWYAAAHADDAKKLDVCRRIHEGAAKAAGTIGDAIAAAVNRHVADGVTAGLVATTPAPAAA